MPSAKVTFEEARTKLRSRFSALPSPYWVSRGFSREFLDERDIGEVHDSQGEFAYRAVLPVRHFEDFSDPQSIYTAGYTARSLYTPCPKCELYHNRDEACPQEAHRGKYAKWLHSKFSTEEYFYGLDFALESIQETHTAILVESPGDVLRMHSSGFLNTLGLFGVYLSDRKQITLEELGVLRVVVLLNHDAAGNKGKADIKKKLSRLFSLFFPSLPEEVNDCCEMTEDDLVRCLESQKIFRTNQKQS